MIDMICSLSSVSNSCALSPTLYYNLLSSCLGEYFLGAALENSVTQLNPLPASLNTTMMAHGRLSGQSVLMLANAYYHALSHTLIVSTSPSPQQATPHSVCAIQIEHAMWISRDMSYTHVLQHILYRRSIRY